MLLIMSWRNLWRNSRRTLLTAAAISLGLAFLITMVSFSLGFLDMMVEQVARSSIGHIQLHQSEYMEKKSIHLVMTDADRMTREIEAVPGVAAASQRLVFSGAIRSSMSSSVRVVQVMAVDPEREQHFSALDEKVVEGGFIVPPAEATDPDAPVRLQGRKGILIGRKLAEQLKVELGSKLRLDTSGFDGGTAASAFYVTGIMETGSSVFDQGMVLVNIRDMREATGAGEVAHEISIMADNPRELDSLAAAVAAHLKSVAGEPGFGSFEVLPWYLVSPDIKQMIDMSKNSVGLLYMLMLIILSAGILTTMFMVVYERRREFGVQLALGTRPATLFAGVIMEAVFIAALAVAAGLALGGIAVFWLVNWGLDLSSLMEGFDFAGLFIPNVYKGSAAAEVFIEPAMVVFIGTVIIALWPALRVARMKALDGLKD